eukprot:1160464-Pelagomonas_calceolata.AAC.15
MHVTTAHLYHQSTMGPAAHHLHHCKHWLVQPQHQPSCHLEGTPWVATGFFCFAGCLFLDAWALATLAWFAKSCWVGDTGLSHLARGLELERGLGRPFSAQALLSPKIN